MSIAKRCCCEARKENCKGGAPCHKVGEFRQRCERQGEAGTFTCMLPDLPCRFLLSYAAPSGFMFAFSTFYKYLSRTAFTIKGSVLFLLLFFGTSNPLFFGILCPLLPSSLKPFLGRRRERNGHNHTRYRFKAGTASLLSSSTNSMHHDPFQCDLDHPRL